MDNFYIQNQALLLPLIKSDDELSLSIFRNNILYQSKNSEGWWCRQLTFSGKQKKRKGRNVYLKGVPFQHAVRNNNGDGYEEANDPHCIIQPYSDTIKVFSNEARLTLYEMYQDLEKIMIGKFIFILYENLFTTNRLERKMIGVRLENTEDRMTALCVLADYKEIFRRG